MHIYPFHPFLIDVVIHSSIWQDHLHHSREESEGGSRQVLPLTHNKPHPHAGRLFAVHFSNVTKIRWTFENAEAFQHPILLTEPCVQINLADLIAGQRPRYVDGLSEHMHATRQVLLGMLPQWC